MISNKLFNKSIDVKFNLPPWNKDGEFGIVRIVTNNDSQQEYQVNRTYNCRETFAKAWSRVITEKRSKHICFFVQHRSHINVAKFIKKLEDTLGLKDRTICRKSKRLVYLIIEPSKWWLQSTIRRSVFTIFLRASRKYDGKSFEKAIYSQKYFRWTKNAVEQFLEGNTYYRGKSGNWVNVFLYASKSKIDQKLLPESEELS